MIKKIVSICFVAALAMIPNFAIAGQGTHGHFAAFLGEGVDFPDTIKGDDIEGPMVKKGAEMMLFAHSASIRDGDVLNLQNDTLRDVGGEFKDFGLNCQVSIAATGDWAVSGMCKVFFTGNSKLVAIPSVPVNEQLVWYKLFEDKTQGVAGYFMKEYGNVLE